MYAVVRTGGKQYRVTGGSIIHVEKIEAEDGSMVELPDVLMLADGDDIRIGAPTVAGVKVTAKVVTTAKGKKIRGYTYKPTKNIQRHYGHRQWRTTLRIESIDA